jgi:polyphosphate glucokinase
MKILAIDVGGTAVKLRLDTDETVRRIPSGPRLTPAAMIAAILDAMGERRWDVVSLGYPGTVRDGRPAREPHNLGPGWVDFDFRAAFGRPVRIVNDAAMQAIGSYAGGRMLFLGLGTGLGSAMVVYGAVVPMELSRLPYRDGGSFGDFLGQRGLDRLGLDAWRSEVAAAVTLLREALVADYVILGGGNVARLTRMPAHARPGHNANAFEGAFRLWRDPDIRL